MNALAVERLSKAFGGVRAVDDVSFAVGAGERVALIGPNGAGKTTLFNAVNGQLRPDSGSIRQPPSAAACFLLQSDRKTHRRKQLDQLGPTALLQCGK